MHFLVYQFKFHLLSLSFESNEKSGLINIWDVAQSSHITVGIIE